MSLVKGRNGNKPRNRNRMHPNEQRMQEDYYSSAYAKQQKEESEMASLSIQSPTKSKEEVIMTEQTQQDQEVTITETVTKPSTRRALPARQAKQQPIAETPAIILPPPSDYVGDELNIKVTIDPELFTAPVNEGYTDRLTPEEAALDQHLDALQVQNPDVNVKEEFTKALFEAMPPEIVSQVIAELPTEVKEKIEVILEPEVPVTPEVRKRTIPETRGARPSMLPPKVEPTVKVVSEVPAGYVDAGDRYERKVEASLLGVTASVTMTKPKPGSGGMLIFEGRVDLHESEGVQFWRPVFSRNVTSDDEIPAHYLPAILAAVDWRNCGLTEPVKLVAINCRCAAQSNNAMDVSSDDDGTIITLLSA